jgi:D-alanyl-D-alanine carboxypeptidase
MTRSTWGRIAGALAALLLGLAPIAARAQIGSDRYSSIVIEAATGTVLSAVNPDEPRHPASLTKMMTLYMLFEALRDHRISLDEPVTVSPHAAAMVPTKLGLRPGMFITVEEAILGLVTKSANDAAAALGELLGGDEDRFAEMMTLRARALGMRNTVFRNASGLPDPEQISTARDLALLGRHLVQDFPAEYRYFSTPSFVFHGRTIYNHDLMLQRYPGADGIKTGYIEAAGHNLVTSAVRDNVRLIGVVLGAASNGERDLHMASLLDAGFDQLQIPPPSARDVQAWRSTSPLFSTAQAATLPPVYRPAAAGRAALPETPPRPPRAAAVQFASWGLQVGAFASEGAAQQAASAARRMAGAGETHVEQISARGRPIWRAQLVGMSEPEMRGALNALARHRITAQPLRPEAERLASR